MNYTVKLAFALLIVYFAIGISAKTLNLIDIYRSEVFDIAVMRNRKPVIVFYSKPSCTICTRLQEKMENIAKKNSEEFYFALVNLEKLPELQEKFEITSIPTTRAFYKGEMIGEVKGPKLISMKELTDQVIAL